MSRESSARYYQKNDENIFKFFISRDRYQDFSEDGKNKKQEYGRERYKNRSEDDKQKLLKYRKRYYEMQKNNCKVTL